MTQGTTPGHAVLGEKNHTVWMVEGVTMVGVVVEVAYIQDLTLPVSG